MTPVFLPVLLLVQLGYSTPAEKKAVALRFGQTIADYIEWSPVDMTAFRTQFTVCTWIKKRYRASPGPMVLSYHLDTYSGMILGDDGFYNQVVGTHLDLQDLFNVPDGKWFHVCWTWTTSNYRTTVYLNGEEIGFAVTHQREIRTGGTICLGNWAQTKRSYYIFGGDLFKLNIYNKVFGQSEISSMASDIYSPEEEKQNAHRILKWEEIVLKGRSGSVTEIRIECSEYAQMLYDQAQRNLKLVEDRLLKTEQLLEQSNRDFRNVSQILNVTKQELAETKTHLTKSLITTQNELNVTKQELAETKTNLTKSLITTQNELNVTKQEMAETKNDLTKSLISTQKELNVTAQQCINKHGILTNQLINLSSQHDHEGMF